MVKRCGTVVVRLIIYPRLQVGESHLSTVIFHNTHSYVTKAWETSTSASRCDEKYFAVYYLP